MADVSFSFNLDGNIGVLSVSGSIDAHSAPLFDKRMKESLDKSKKIILDVSKLDYISTAGLGVLIASFNEAKSKGGDVILSNMTDKIRKVFDTMGFSKVLKIAASNTAAKSLFK